MILVDAKLIMTVEQMKDRDVWRQTRNLGIGGSDAGAGAQGGADDVVDADYEVVDDDKNN